MSDLYGGGGGGGPYALQIPGNDRFETNDLPLAALRTQGNRMQVLAQSAPWLAENPYLLSVLSSVPLDEMQLADSAITLGASMDYANFEQWWGRQSAADQRVAWNTLTGAQQQALANNGMAPDLDPPKRKRSWMPDLGIVSDVFEVPADLIKGTAEKAMETLMVGQNTINASYRVVRGQEGWRAWAAGGAMIGGALAAGKVPGLGSTVFRGVGGRVLAGLAAGNAAVLATNGPTATVEAWKQAWNGERFFTRGSIAEAGAYLDQRPELMDLAMKLTDEPVDLARAFAGRRDPRAGKVRDAAVFELSLRYGPEGSEKQRAAAGWLAELADDPNFQQAISILEAGKISPGRDLARILPGSDQLVSGSIDAAWNFVADPFLVGGRLLTAKNLARRGIWLPSATETTPSALKRVTALTEQRVVRNNFTQVADAINAGDEGLLWARDPAWRDLSPTYKLWASEQGVVEHSADTIAEWFKSGTGLMELAAGNGATWRKGFITLPSWTFMDSARFRASDWARGTINFAAEVKMPKGATIDPLDVLDDTHLQQLGHTRADLEKATTIGDRHSVTQGIVSALGEVPLVRDVLSGSGRFLRGFTTQIPPEGTVRLGTVKEGVRFKGGDVTQLRNYVELLGQNMPADVRERWFNLITSTESLGGRLMATRQFLHASMEGSGVTFTKEGRELVERIVHSFDQAYGLGDIDKLTVNGLQYRMGLLPMADQAVNLPVPSVKDLRLAVKQHAVLSTVLNVGDSKLLEAYMSRVWKPFTILRWGFVLRAGGEEALSTIARFGSSAYLHSLAMQSFLKPDDAYLAGTRWLARMNGWVGEHTAPWLYPEAFEDFADIGLKGLASNYRRFMRNNFWNDGILGTNVGNTDLYTLLSSRSETFKTWLDQPTKVGRALLRGFDATDLAAARSWMSDPAVQRAFAESLSAINHGLADGGKDVNQLQIVQTRQGRTTVDQPVVAVRGQHKVTNKSDDDPFWIAGVWNDMSRPIMADKIVARSLLQTYPDYVTPRMAEAFRIMADRMGLAAGNGKVAFESITLALDDLKEIDEGLHAVVMELFDSSGSDAHFTRALSRAFGNRKGGVSFIRRMRRFSGEDGFSALRGMWSDPFLAPLRSKQLKNGMYVEDFVKRLTDADPNIDINALRRWLPLNRRLGSEPMFSVQEWRAKVEEAFFRQLTDPANQQWVQGAQWALMDTVSGYPVVANQIGEATRALYAPQLVGVRPELVALANQDPSLRLGDVLRQLIDQGAIAQPLDGNTLDLLKIANTVTVGNFMQRVETSLMGGATVPVAFSDPVVARTFARMVNPGDGQDWITHVVVDAKVGSWAQPGTVDPSIGRFLAIDRSDGLGPPLRMWDVREDFPFKWRPVEPNMTYQTVNGQIVPGVTQEMALRNHSKVLAERMVQVYHAPGRGSKAAIEGIGTADEAMVGGPAVSPSQRFLEMDIPPGVSVREDWSVATTRATVQDGERVILWNPRRVADSWADLSARVGQPLPPETAVEDVIPDLADLSGTDTPLLAPDDVATGDPTAVNPVFDLDLTDLANQQRRRLVAGPGVDRPGGWERAESLPVMLARVEQDLATIAKNATDELYQAGGETAGAAFSEAANAAMVEQEVLARQAASGLPDVLRTIEDEIAARGRIADVIRASGGNPSRENVAEIIYQQELARTAEAERRLISLRRRATEQYGDGSLRPEVAQVKIREAVEREQDNLRRRYANVRSARQQWERERTEVVGALDQRLTEKGPVYPGTAPDDHFYEGLLANLERDEAFLPWAHLDVDPVGEGSVRVWRVEWVDSQGKVLGWDGRTMTRSLGHGYVWSPDIEAAYQQADLDPYGMAKGLRRRFPKRSEQAEPRLVYLDVPEGQLSGFDVGAHWGDEVGLRQMEDDHKVHLSWFSNHAVDEQGQFFLEPWSYGYRSRSAPRWEQHLVSDAPVPDVADGYTRVWRAEASYGGKPRGDHARLKVTRQAPPEGTYDRATGTFTLADEATIQAKIADIEERLAAFGDRPTGVNVKGEDIGELEGRLQWELKRLRNTLEGKRTPYSLVEGEIWSPTQDVARRQLMSGRSSRIVRPKDEVRWYYMDVPTQELTGRRIAEVKQNWMDSVLSHDKVMRDIGSDMTQGEMKRARYVRRFYDEKLNQTYDEPVTFRSSHYEINYNRHGFRNPRGDGSYLIEEPGKGVQVGKRLPPTQANVKKMRRYMAAWDETGENPLELAPDVLARYRRLEGKAPMGSRTLDVGASAEGSGGYVDGWGNLWLDGDGVAVGARGWVIDRDMVDPRAFTSGTAPVLEGQTRIWKTADGWSFTPVDDAQGTVDVSDEVIKRWKKDSAGNRVVPKRYEKHVQVGETLNGQVVVPAGYWRAVGDEAVEVPTPTAAVSDNDVAQRWAVLERQLEEGTTPGTTPFKPDLQEIWRRLGVDEHELYAWFQANGGMETWAKFILAHELGHVTGGHVGAERLAGLGGHAGEPRYLRETIAMDHAFERLNMPFGTNRARHLVEYDPSVSAQSMWDDIKIGRDDTLDQAEMKFQVLADMAHRYGVELPPGVLGMGAPDATREYVRLRPEPLTADDVDDLNRRLAGFGEGDEEPLHYFTEGMSTDDAGEMMGEVFSDAAEAAGYASIDPEDAARQTSRFSIIQQWFSERFEVPSEQLASARFAIGNADFRQMIDKMSQKAQIQLDNVAQVLRRITPDSIPPTMGPGDVDGILGWFTREDSIPMREQWRNLWEENPWLDQVFDATDPDEVLDQLVRNQATQSPTRVESGDFPGAVIDVPRGESLLDEIRLMLAHAPTSRYTLDDVHALLRDTDAPNEWFRRQMAQLDIRVGDDDLIPQRQGLVEPMLGQPKIGNDTADEVRWEVAAPLLQDAQDELELDAVFRNGHVVSRATREHVHDLGDKMPQSVIRPDWQIASDYRINANTGKLEKSRPLDRFTDKAFAAVGRGIDAVARRPLALHLYMQGYRQGLVSSRWLLDPTIFGRGGQAMFSDQVPDAAVSAFNDQWRVANSVVDEIGAGQAIMDPEYQAALAEMMRLRQAHPDLVVTEQGSGRAMIERWQGEVDDVAAAIAADPALRPVLDWIGAQLQPGVRTFNWQGVAEAYVNDPASVRGAIEQLVHRHPARGADVDRALVALDEHAVAAVDPDELLQRVNQEWGRSPKFAKMNRGSWSVKDLPGWFAKRVRPDDLEVLHAIRGGYAAIEPGIRDIATTRMVKDAIPFIDDHNVRSQFQEHVRNFVPFWFAEEQFLKRWSRTLRINPSFLRKAQLTYLGLKDVGFISQDERGQDVFYLPAVAPVAEFITSVPWLNLHTGGLAQLPEGVGMGLAMRPQDLLPGFNRVGAPTGGPMVGIPLRLLSNVLPELKSVEAGIMGQENLNRGYLQMVVPRPFLQAWEAFAAHEDSSRQMANQMTQAISMLESGGHGLEPDATSTDLQVNIDRVRNHARNVGVLRMIAGFFTPGSSRPTYTQGTEWGFSANRLNIQPELLQLIRTHGYEEGYNRFVERHPDATPWTVFATETASGAIIPSTTEAWNFYLNNEEVLKQYPNAGPWLLPPNQGDDFDSQAFGEMMAEGLRQRLGPTEYWRAMKFAEASRTYFDSIDRYRQTRDSTLDVLEKTLHQMDWDVWRKDYLATHPIFGEELTSAEGRQRRTRVLSEMRSIVDDPAAPKPWHFDSVKTMVESFDRYKATISSLGASRTTIDEMYREQFKTQFRAWAEQFIVDHPEVQHLWYSVIKPESYLEET